jgi:hypothetical protein
MLITFQNTLQSSYVKEHNQGHPTSRSTLFHFTLRVKLEQLVRGMLVTSYHDYCQ